MVESRQGFGAERENANRIIDNQPHVEGRNTNMNTDAEYYNRMNYEQPEQPYSGSVNPNMGAGMPRNNYPQPTIPQPNASPSQKQKNEALSRALLGGLIGGALGSLAAALAGKKLAQGLGVTTKGLGNAAKTVGSGLLHTVQSAGEAVKAVADGTTHAVVGGAMDTVKGVADGATQVAASAVDTLQNTASGVSQGVKTGADAVKNTAQSANQSVSSQYQDRTTIGNQSFGSEQPTSVDADSLEEEINQIDISAD